MFKALIITVLTVTDFNFQPFRQSIYNRSTNTVQTAGDLVSAAAEFTACMQNGKDNCYSRNAQLWLNANWNASSIILNTDNISRQKVDQNLGTVSCQNLIDRVVHDLIDQMMKTLWAGGTDIHTRTLAYCVQTFQNLNITCVVIFNHLRIFSGVFSKVIPSIVYLLNVVLFLQHKKAGCFSPFLDLPKSNVQK